MADDVDITTERAEAEEALRRRHAKTYLSKPKLAPKGACHFCAADLEDQRRLYCDAVCASRHGK